MASSCKKIFSGYPGLETELSQTEVIYTGNPVQDDIAKGDRAQGRQTGRFSREDIVLLVLGGSGGAASINRAIARIAGILDQKGNIRIWWQTGRREYEKWKSRITPELFPGTMCPFIENMADAYAAADLVVARAGAMTTAEICASGKPAVLVPFPRAAGNHQLHNAKVLVDRGAALWVHDEELETEKLAETLLCLASDRTQQARLAASARRLGRPDAAANIVDALEDYL
jgi:UDP-N-acetylglucosamine--N-acetylmuramyl-(pentapeptide) pyrophosphoryl-undecaprenol N-acetylglucosamine transferase